MAMEPRVSIITLGVDDLDRAVAFYEAMGLERHGKITDGVAFFQMGGLILALWPREEMAKDIGAERPAPAPEAIVVPAPGGAEKTGAFVSPDVALAYNTRSEDEVAHILARAERAGGRIVKSAHRAFWGGVQGYFADSEGNLWEVAYNPDFPIDDEGRISLPE